ncbi:VMAP-C domain-containing protein [Streptomyces sp. NPDC001840]
MTAVDAARAATEAALGAEAGTGTGTDSWAPIDPSRVFALVVGIESYEVSHRWNLTGAARDAERFAGWLTGQAGVPADNVRLLVSSLERTDPEQDLTVRQLPTKENIERILFKELPACDGDLLWLYWAGHGYLDQSHRMLLPYADATKDFTSHLNLEEALRWWKSSRLPPGRFHRQIAIGDACRVDTGRAAKLAFGSSAYGVGGTVPERRQFTLYASHQGEVAQNLTDKGAGQFTDTLLRRLDGRTLDETVQGLVGIARSVQADFHLLRSRGLAWQEPQFVIGRDWSGSAVLGDAWTETGPGGGGPGAPGLDQTAWTELGALLRNRDVPPFACDAYLWAFEVTGCAPPARRSLPPGGLTEIARDLDNRQGRQRDMPLTLPFVRHLAARSDDPAWARSADTWVDTTRERLGAAPVPAPPEPAREGTALHVRLTAEEAEADEVHWVRMWLYRNSAFETVWESERPLPMATVREKLGEQLLAGSADRLTRIEFHVPYELLGEAFECWGLPIGRAGRTIELGSHYEVMVRCPDERTGIAHSHWRRKWDWFKTHGGEDRKAVHQVRDDDVSSMLGVFLQAAEPPVCVLAEVSEDRLMDALDAVLDAGVPIAVWRRDGRTEDTELSSELAAGADADAGIDVRQLPAVLRTLRIPGPQRAQQAPRPLALMWDDPERVPERRSLS